MRVQDGHNLISLNDGIPSPCEVYGHFWQATNKPGRYRCANCKQIGYCSACLLTVPSHVLVMRCGQHQETEIHD